MACEHLYFLLKLVLFVTAVFLLLFCFSLCGVYNFAIPHGKVFYSPILFVAGGNGALMSGFSPPRTRQGTIYCSNMDSEEAKALSERLDVFQANQDGLNTSVQELSVLLTKLSVEISEFKQVKENSAKKSAEIVNSDNKNADVPSTDTNGMDSGQFPRPNSSLFLNPTHTEHRLLTRRDIDANFLAFSKQNPSTWFKVTEERFEYLGITSDEDKFWVVLKCIGPALFDELEAFLPSLRPENKYPILKTEILRKLAQSEDDKLDRLLRESNIGKRTPSEYFNVIQSLSSGIMNQDAALRFWWKGLPTDIAISVDPEIHNLDTAAAVEKANRIAELKRRNESQASNVSICVAETPQASRDGSQQGMAERMDRIEAFVKNESRSRKASKNKSKHFKSRNRSVSNEPVKTSSWLCFYHHSYGEQAKYCAKGCTWKSQQEAKLNLPQNSNSKNE